MQRKRISQSLPSLLVLLTLIGCISITDAKTVNGVMTTADSKLYSGQYIASFCFHGEYLLNRTIEQKEDRERGSVKPGRAGPCPITAIWRCHNNSSQWQRSFQWKLRSHWLKFLWRHHVAVVRQGPGPVTQNIYALETTLVLWNQFPVSHNFQMTLVPWPCPIWSTWR